MRNNKVTAFSVLVLSVLFLFVLSASTALADKSGRTGSTISGCTCHDQGAGTGVSIQGVSGNTIYIKPNETRSFTAIVAHSGMTKAGINISIKNSGGNNVGNLSAGTGTKKQNNEITHNSSQNITGSQAIFGFSWTAPGTTGTYILRAAGCAANNNNLVSGDEANAMAEISVVVTNPSITLTNPNGGESICKNTQMLIAWTSIAITNVKIEISSNGGSTWNTITTVAASSNFYQWTVPTAQTSATTYRVRVSDATTASVNDVSNANFSILTVPVIINHPKHDSVCAGGTVTYSITTDNLPGYTYQWRRNAVPIVGATGTSYTITNAQQSNVGDYDVIVTGCTPVTSNFAIFQLNTPPSIIVQQNDTTVCKGSSASLHCVASGANLTYQWKRNGANLTGATSSTLDIAIVNPSDTGIYTVEVSGRCPSPQTSNPTHLRFTTAPIITKQPHDTTVCIGETVQFTVDGGGSDDISYQWRKDGKNIEGAVGNVLTLIHITSSDVASYDVIVKNSCNLSTTSSPALLKAKEPVLITTQPKDTTVQSGVSASFSVVAKGTSVKYQWQKNGVNRQGDTSQVLMITSAKPSDSGNYKCVVKNECGTVESAVVKLKVTAPPAGASLVLGVNTVNYGCQALGSSFDYLVPKAIYNVGGQILEVSNVTITGTDAADFSIKTGGGAHSLAPNQGIVMSFVFSPKTKGEKNAFVEFTSNSTTASPKLLLTGKGCEAVISPKAKVIDAGTVLIGDYRDTMLVICNTGDLDLTIASVSFGGANDKDFTLRGSTIFPFIIHSGECDTLTIRFTPSAEGKRTANITFIGNAQGIAIDLEGNGTAVVGVNEYKAIAGGVSVYPNPSSGSVVITGTSASLMPIKVHIFDGLGNTIYQTIANTVSAGEFSVVWDAMHNGSPVSSGNYTAVLIFGTQTVNVPFVIVK